MNTRTLSEQQQLAIQIGVVAAVGIGTAFLIWKCTKHHEEEQTCFADELHAQAVHFIDNFNQKKADLMSDIANKSVGWAQQFLDKAESITEEAKNWAETLYVAADKANQRAEELNLNPRYRHKVEELMVWSQKAIEIADHLTDDIHKWSKQAQEFAEENGSENDNEKKYSTAVDIIDWVSIGINLWRQLKR